MSKPRLHALDGLRGVAALMIVTYHTQGVLEAQIPISSWTQFLKSSYLFVELFFILSGYTLTRVYEERFANRFGMDAYLGFQRRRLARIYPLHLFLLFAMLAGVLIIALPLEKKFSLPALFSNIALIQAWGIHDRLTWNLPAWYLSAQFACYLLFPFLALWLARTAQAGRALLAVACVAVLFALFAHAGTLDLTYDFGVPRGLAEFVLGMLLYKLDALRKLAHWLCNTPAQLIVLIALSLCLHLGGMDPIVALLMAALAMSLSEDRGLLARALAHRWVQWIGGYSFAVYLVHYPVGRLFKGRQMPLESLLGADTWMGAVSHYLEAMLAFFIVAWVLTRYLVEPAQRRIRG